MINLMILPVDPVHVQNQLDREIAEMVSVFKSKIIWFAEKKQTSCLLHAEGQKATHLALRWGLLVDFVAWSYRMNGCDRS